MGAWGFSAEILFNMPDTFFICHREAPKPHTHELARKQKTNTNRDIILLILFLVLTAKWLGGCPVNEPRPYRHYQHLPFRPASLRLFSQQLFFLELPLSSFLLRHFLCHAYRRYRYQSTLFLGVKAVGESWNPLYTCLSQVTQSTLVLPAA